jgi:hypothetical protein
MISVEAEVKRQFERHFGKGSPSRSTNSRSGSLGNESTASPAFGSWRVGIGLGIAVLVFWFFAHPTNKHQAVRPPTGTSLVTVNSKVARSKAGLSDLTIENNADKDAVVKMAANEPDESLRVYRAVYVRAGDQWVVPSIAPGTYRLLFCLGTDWDPQQRTFFDPGSCTEFKAPVTFQETRTVAADGRSAQTDFDHVHIKLQATLDGNAQTEPVDQALFESGR